MLDRHTHQPLGAGNGSRLDAYDGVFANAFLCPSQHLIVEEINQFLDFRRALLPFDAGINVFCIFTEDRHVELLRMSYRRRHALVVAHRTYAGVKIEYLPQCYVQRADATAHRRGQRTFNSDMEIPDRIDRLVGKPVAEFGKSLLACEHFKPVDFAFTAICALHGSVKHAHGSGPNIAASALSFGVRNDRIVRNLQFAVAKSDCTAAGWKRSSVV